MERAVLNIQVHVAPEDSGVVAAMGWPGTRVPGSEVEIRRLGSTTTETAVTGPEGAVRFTNLLPGNYSISALREITAAERELLGTDDADVTALAGGRVAAVAAPAAETVVSLAAGRRGSLVFSEVFAPTPQTGAGDYYYFGHYIELTNNSETIIYLDGKNIGMAQSWNRDFSNYPCDMMEKWRLDPEGIWTAFWYTFPGGGTQYPLLPGRSVVIATDAVNHREYVAGLVDLSRADFEFIGSQDVDNPAVPNMITANREWAAGVSGHGYYVPSSAIVLFVSEALNRDDLAMDELPVAQPEYFRIPADRILDVISTGLTPDREAGMSYPLCPEIVHPSLDRRHAELRDTQTFLSIKRKTFTTLEDGRTILQRTRTSARDFEHGPPTPGRVP